MSYSNYYIFNILNGSLFFITGCFLLVGCHAGLGNTRTIQVEERSDTEGARRLNGEAVIYMDGGRIDDAEVLLDKAIDADENYGLAYNNLGYIYYLRQDYYRAAWAFEKAIAEMPRAGPPLNNMGLVMEGAGRLSDAVSYYERAWEINPENFDYVSNLARSKYLRGDRDQLLRELVKKIAVQAPSKEWSLWASDRLREDVLNR